MEPQTFTRRRLYDLAWKEPIQALAARFGLSDGAVTVAAQRVKHDHPRHTAYPDLGDSPCAES